jgi:EmrB/QacA subfamily drug resistance transporter
MERQVKPIVFLAAAAMFMEILDGTVIVTALPRMGAVFGVSPVAMNLAITAYLLAVAVCLPAVGWAAERYGARRLFMLGLAVFTLASAFCAASPRLGIFLVARVLQGAGGAAMVSVGRLAVLRVTPKSQLVHAIGTIVWPSLIGPVVAPTLGGLLVTYANWRWIFLINLPFGVLAILAASRLMPKGGGNPGEPLDIGGMALLGLGLAALVGGANEIEALGTAAFGLVILGAVLLWLTWRHCQRHPAPLLRFDALRYPSFATNLTGGSAFKVAITSAPFLLPLLFQLVMGYSPVQSGLLLLALFAGNLLMKTQTTRGLRLFGFRRVIIVNGCLVAASLAACAGFAPGTPLVAMLPILFVGGLCRSMQFTAFNTLQFADVPPAETGPANTLSNLANQLGMGLGPAFGALVLDLLTWMGHRPSPDLADFRIAFVLSAMLSLLAVRSGLRLAPDAGTLVSHHQPPGRAALPSERAGGIQR